MQQTRLRPFGQKGAALQELPVEIALPGPICDSERFVWAQSAEALGIPVIMYLLPTLETRAATEEAVRARCRTDSGVRTISLRRQCSRFLSPPGYP